MAITLPDGLPARRLLHQEGIKVTGIKNNGPWNERPLRIALVNLMPNKPVTETQIVRLLGSADTPVELTLVIPDGYTPKTTPTAHIDAFYERWSAVRHRQFDGLIITGAPIETLPFEQVTYWRALTAIFDWAEDHVHRCYYICWAAQAALYHFHGVGKHALPDKMFGVFEHHTNGAQSPLLAGLEGTIPVPVSRHTEVRAADLPRDAGLAVLAEAADAGLCLIEDRRHHAVYMFNHLEYDAETLGLEYVRDRDAGKPITIPQNYFPDDDPSRQPENTWRHYGRRLFGNWLREMADTTPFSFSNEQMLQWLINRDRMPTLAGEDLCDVLVLGTQNLDTLPTLLRHLAEQGLSPRAVKVSRSTGATMLIWLRLDDVDDGGTERLSHGLLKIDAVQRVAYQCARNGGGILSREGPPAETSPAHRRRSPGLRMPAGVAA